MQSLLTEIRVSMFMDLFVPTSLQTLEIFTCCEKYTNDKETDRRKI